MSVQTHDPAATTVHIRLTPAAEAQARRKIAEAGALGIRLGVKPAGCSGYKYVLDYAHTEDPTDTRLAIADGVVVYVAADSRAMLNGMEMDYVTEGVNRFFRFRNPNATGECGCGESFTVDA